MVRQVSRGNHGVSKISNSILFSQVSYAFQISRCYILLALRFAPRDVLTDEALSPHTGCIDAMMASNRNGLSAPEAMAETNHDNEKRSSTHDNPSGISSDSTDTIDTKPTRHTFWTSCWDIVTWTPPRCRWDPNNPPKFSWPLNLLFAFVSTIVPYYKDRSLQVVV
jgi:hypothetical protein